MESIEVAAIKVGQSVTLEMGDKEPILTKLEDPRKFKMEDWAEEEMEVYILEDVIEEDEPLHYSLKPFDSLDAAKKENEGKFGVNRTLFTFLNREVEGIEMEEEEAAG